MKRRRAATIEECVDLLAPEKQIELNKFNEEGTFLVDSWQPRIVRSVLEGIEGLGGHVHLEIEVDE